MGNMVVKWDDIGIFGKTTRNQKSWGTCLQSYGKKHFSTHFSEVLKCQAKEFGF